MAHILCNTWDFQFCIMHVRIMALWHVITFEHFGMLLCNTARESRNDLVKEAFQEGSCDFGPVKKPYIPGTQP